jgi:hypothetical protein
VPVRRPKRIAEIVFRGAGIPRNLFFNEIDNPLEQLRSRMNSRPLPGQSGREMTARAEWSGAQNDPKLTSGSTAHSITASAMASTPGGTSMPSARAV